MVFKNGKYIGVVTEGEGIAFRDFDVPTANLSFEEEVNVEPGVYAALTEYRGKEYESVLCYGVGEPPKFEVHLFDFNDKIYGETLKVGIVEKVSEVIPWDSKERMRQKIIHDLELVRALFKRKRKKA